MGVRVVHDLDDLEADLKKIIRKVPGDLTRTVSKGVRVGASVARDLTKERGGSHSGVGKKGVQPLVRSITSEMTVHGLGGLYAGEFGPDESMKQARVMRVLEHGTIHTAPKNIMANSADLMGPALAGEVHRLTGGWFWS